MLALPVTKAYYFGSHQFKFLTEPLQLVAFDITKSFEVFNWFLISIRYGHSNLSNLYEKFMRLFQTVHKYLSAADKFMVFNPHTPKIFTLHI